MADGSVAVALPPTNPPNRIKNSMSNHVDRIRIGRLKNELLKMEQEAKLPNYRKEETEGNSGSSGESQHPLISSKERDLEKDSEQFTNLNRSHKLPSRHVSFGTSKDRFYQDFVNRDSRRLESRSNARTFEKQKGQNTNIQDSEDSSNVKKGSSSKVSFGTSKDRFYQDFLNRDSRRSESRTNARTFEKLQVKKTNIQDSKNLSNVKKESSSKVSFVCGASKDRFYQDFLNRDSRHPESRSNARTSEKLKGKNTDMQDSKESSNVKKGSSSIISFGASKDRIKEPTDFVNRDSRRQGDTSDAKAFDKPKGKNRNKQDSYVKNGLSKNTSVTRRKNNFNTSKFIIGANKNKTTSSVTILKRKGTKHAKEKDNGKLYPSISKQPEIAQGQELKSTELQNKTKEEVRSSLKKNYKKCLEDKNVEKQGTADPAGHLMESKKKPSQDAKDNIAKNWFDKINEPRASKMKSNEESQKVNTVQLLKTRSELDLEKKEVPKEKKKLKVQRKPGKKILSKKSQSVDSLKKKQIKPKAKSSNRSAKSSVSETALNKSRTISRTKVDGSEMAPAADYAPEHFKSGGFSDVEMSISEQGKIHIVLDLKSLSPEDVAVVVWLDDLKSGLNLRKLSSSSVTESLADSEKQDETVMNSNSVLHLEDISSPRPNIYFPPVTIMKNVSVRSKVGLHTYLDDTSNSVFYSRCNIPQVDSD